MTTLQSRVPGHGRATARIRLRLGILLDDPKRGRVWDRSSVGPYELICEACGDDVNLNYGEVAPHIQEIRGSYLYAEEARASLARHLCLMH
jgi:hypothetical protein